MRKGVQHSVLAMVPQQSGRKANGSRFFLIFLFLFFVVVVVVVDGKDEMKWWERSV